MARLVVLLRGVNLVKHNRVSMPVLREALEEAGFDDVKTYVQSGNVVVTTERSPAGAARVVAGVVEERFGIDIGVVVRTRGQLAKIVARDPLGSVATDPRRYHVTFLAGKLDRSAVQRAEAAASGDEQLLHAGQELYAWYPSGVGGSKLARLLSGTTLGVTATSRNWATVTALLTLADEG